MLYNPLQARELFQHAQKNQYAILAVNADSPAAVLDCLEAARIMNAPLIIETSLWQLKGRSFGAGDALLGMARYLTQLHILAGSERYAHLPVIYHTDHIRGPETVQILQRAIQGIPLKMDDHSFNVYASTVSLDASELNIEQNVAMIQMLCRFALEAGREVTLEMESAVDEGITSHQEALSLLAPVEAHYPDRIHLWAPAVGTKHGFGENMAFSPDTVEKQRKLVKEITGREIGIALHGSTGLTVPELTGAVAAGVIKVNWSTESFHLLSEAAREYYSREEKFDKKHPQWKNTAMDSGIQEFIAERYIPRVVELIGVLGGEGQAGMMEWQTR